MSKTRVELQVEAIEAKVRGDHEAERKALDELHKMDATCPRCSAQTVLMWDGCEDDHLPVCEMCGYGT